MKKKERMLWASALLIGLGTAACSDDNDSPLDQPLPVPDAAELYIAGDSAVAQLDTTVLKARTTLKNVAYYQWTLDGKIVSTDSTYAFSAPKTGSHKLLLTAYAEDDILAATKTVDVTPRFARGTLVLSEGNMSDETGVLTFIDEQGTAVDSAYWRVNGTLLGNVCQDLFIAGGKLYVLSQNGAKNGGEGILTIAQADNLEKLKVWNDPDGTLSWPSNVAVTGNEIYIRDNNGVYMLNADTEALTLVENTSGAKKARMAVADGKVFAQTDDQILVIQGGQVVRTIGTPGSLSGIAKAYDGNLWASCNTRPAQFLKISAADGTVIESQEITDGAGLSAGWGVAPAFQAVQDTLYFSNAGFDLYRHVFSTKTTEKVANITESVPDAGIYYNSLGVNPKTGEVCFATLKGYGMNYKTNDIAIFDFGKNPALQADHKSMNSFPAGVFYTYTFE